MRCGADARILTEALTTGCRIDVVRGGQVLAVDLPVIEATAEWTASRAVPGRLTYRLPLDWTPEGPLHPASHFGQWAHPTMILTHPDGRTWETSLPPFLHVSWQVTGTGVEVTALSGEQLLAECPADWGSSPPMGATLSSEVQRLASLPGTALATVLDPGVHDGPVSPATQWGRDRLKAISELVSSRGCLTRWGSDMTLHVHPLRDARTVDEVYPRVLVVGAPPRSVGDGRRPNRWAVTGAKSSDGSEQRWTAVRSVTEEPYTPEIFGVVSHHTEHSAASSQADVERAVDACMADSLRSTQSREVELVADPRLELGDVIGVEVPGEGPVVGRVTGITLPLSIPDSPMGVDLQVLEA